MGTFYMEGAHNLFVKSVIAMRTLTELSGGGLVVLLRRVSTLRYPAPASLEILYMERSQSKTVKAALPENQIPPSLR